jgi:hypothetical protein
MSPFFALYAFHPSIKFHVKDNVLEGEAPVVIKRVERIQEERKILEKRWQDAVDT